MTRLPTVNFNSLNKILLSLGFQAVRQKGSHVFYKHSDGRVTTVPNHGSRDIARPLLREILREIDIAPEQFSDLVQRI